MPFMCLIMQFLNCSSSFYAIGALVSMSLTNQLGQHVAIGDVFTRIYIMLLFRESRGPPYFGWNSPYSLDVNVGMSVIFILKYKCAPTSQKNILLHVK